MQPNRCRCKSPHGERGNLPIATSTCKVHKLRHTQVVVVASNESRRSVWLLQLKVCSKVQYARVQTWIRSSVLILWQLGKSQLSILQSRSDNDVSQTMAAMPEISSKGCSMEREHCTLYHCYAYKYAVQKIEILNFLTSHGLRSPIHPIVHWLWLV